MLDADELGEWPFSGVFGSRKGHSLGGNGYPTMIENHRYACFFAVIAALAPNLKESGSGDGVDQSLARFERYGRIERWVSGAFGEGEHFEERLAKFLHVFRYRCLLLFPVGRTE
jgi:hypothetical protein